MASTDKSDHQHYQALQGQQSHFVYIAEYANGALYTGYTTNVARRVATHNAGKDAKYTRAYLPVTLFASWFFSRKGMLCELNEP